MRNTVQFLNQTFTHARIARLEATLDTDLSYRSLDVDTALVSLSTEDRRTPLLFFTAEPLPFFTRDGLRFNTAPAGEATPTIGAWSRANPLQIYRGGSLFKTFFPASMRRVSPVRTEVTLTSALGILAQLSHKGGVYTGATGANPTTAGDLIREICGYSGSTPGAVTIYVAPEFENIAVYGWLPYVTPSGVAGSQMGSAKDNLLQVLFAINASLRASTDGSLRVVNLSTESQSIISRDRVYRDGAEVEELAPVTSVTVLEHQYFPGSDTETLFDGVTTEGQLIVFSEPMSNLVATGFTITESGANYAVVSAGSGTLTGSPYVHVTREITRVVSNSGPENEMRVEDATLVGITASTDVANRLAAFYACRKYINCSATLNFEDAGDVVDIWDPFDRVMRSACLESIAPAIFSNTAMGTVRALVGFTPWQTEPFDDVREVLTGSGTWTAPADIDPGTEVQVVLIGGAQGGAGGKKGENGSKRNYSYSSTSDWGVIYSGSGIGPAKGGAGGEGGAPGSGGKIFRFSVTVNPGQQILFSCGVGGAGGAAESDTGASGTDTTFGAQSSASGVTSDAGYTDPITGGIYAAKGENGIAGGNGAGKSGNYTPSNDHPLLEYDAAADVTDEDGNIWTGGSTPSDASGRVSVYSQSSGMDQGGVRGSLTAAASAQFGGGAAAGANGINGVGAGSGATASKDGTVISGSAWATNGVNGQNAVLVPHKAANGCGGRGGYGGGGGSAISFAIIETTTYSGSNSPTFKKTIYDATVGVGGNGNTGGDGGDGLAILYYRKPAQTA